MKRKPRQLELGSLGTRPQAPARARRDWTPAEFARVLARNGLRPSYGGTYFSDGRGNHFGAVLCTNPLRINRRATVAQIRRAIREQERAESDKTAADESDSAGRGPARQEPTC